MHSVIAIVVALVGAMLLAAAAWSFDSSLGLATSGVLCLVGAYVYAYILVGDRS